MQQCLATEETTRVSQGREDSALPAVNTGEATDPERSDAVEGKRRAARRRFLLGGASALPVIVSVTPLRAKVVVIPFSACTSIGGNPVTPPQPNDPPPDSGVTCEIPD